MLTIVLLAVLLILFGFIAIVWWDKYGFKEIMSAICTVLGVGVFVALLIVVGFAIDANVGVAGDKAAYQERYDILVYQLENRLYDDDLVGKKELYNQIQEWNEDLAKRKVLQRDLWVGALYPNIYDDFELISFEE